MRRFKGRIRSLLPIFLALFYFNCLTCSAHSPDYERFFDSPEAAAMVFDKAEGLREQLDLIRPMARAYIDAGKFADLCAKLNTTAVPQDAAWHRQLLLAALYNETGDFVSAKKSLAALPEAARQAPEYLKFLQEHPALLPQSRPDFDAVKATLKELYPEKTLALIQAHPDALFDDPQSWAELTASLQAINLLPPLIPLIERNLSGKPENWKLRLLLAQYEIAELQNKKAEENLWKIYDQLSKQQPPPSPGGDGMSLLDRLTTAKRASEDFIAIHDSENGNANPLLKIDSPTEASDLALASLARLVAETGDTDTFLKYMDASLPKDDHGKRILACMLADSAALVFREVGSYLASGQRSPQVEELVIHCFGYSRDMTWNDPGPAGERERLLKIFHDRELSNADDFPEDYDPYGKNEMDAEWFGGTSFMRVGAMITADRVQDPDVRRKAYSLMDIVVETPSYADYGLLFRFDKPTPQNGDIYSRVLSMAAADLVKHFPGCVALAFDTKLEPPYPDMYRRQGGHTWPQSIYDALDKTAADSASPFKDSALLAKAYFMSFEPGREDEALKPMSAAVDKSPSDLLHFRLAEMLAARGDLKSARQQLDAVTTIPGYYAELVQNERASLAGGTGGSVPKPDAPDDFDPPANIGPLVNKFEDLASDVEDNRDADNARKEAAALMKIILKIYPPDLRMPLRGNFLYACNKLGALPAMTALYELVVQKDPGNVEAQYSLATAYAEAGSPKAGDVYLRAFALAPWRADIAHDVILSKIPDDEKTQACVTFLHNSDRPADAVEEYLKAGSFPGYVQALDDWLKTSDWVMNYEDFHSLITNLQKAGKSDDAINLMADADKVDFNVSGNDAFQNIVDILVSQGKQDDAAQVLDRVVFPHDAKSGVYASPDPAIFLDPRGGLSILKKAQSLGCLGAIREHARRILAKQPGDAYARRVLLTCLIVDRDPAFLNDVKPYLKEAKAAGSSSNKDATARWNANADLLHLAQLATPVPAFKPVVFEMLELAQRQATDDTVVESTVVLAQTALDLGDTARARNALQQLLVAGILRDSSAMPRAQPFLGPQWSQVFPLFFRLGMEKEALDYYKMIGDPTSQSTLDYMLAAVESGHPEAARAVVDKFQQLLAKDVTSEAGAQWVDSFYVRRIAVTFIGAGLGDEAARAIDTIDHSWLAADDSSLHHVARLGRDMLARVDAAHPPRAAVFFGGLKDGQMTLWWDMGAWSAPVFHYPTQAVTSDMITYAWDLASRDGRYTLDITAGGPDGRIEHIATIPAAASRGVWRGPVKTPPGDLWNLGATLTGTDGVQVPSPPTSVVVTQNLLTDPDFEQTMKGAKPPDGWDCKGFLSKVPGPVPGVNGVEFHYFMPMAGVIEATCARIPIHPGESYYQSGWVRGGERYGEVDWTCKFLDKDGKEIDNEMAFCNTEDGGDGYVDKGRDGWTFLRQKLLPADASGKPIIADDPRDHLGTDALSPVPDAAYVHVIPPNAAFIQPCLFIRNAAYEWNPNNPTQWAGLSIGVIPPQIAPRPLPH